MNPRGLEISVERAEVHPRSLGQVSNVLESCGRSIELVDRSCDHHGQTGQRSSQFVKHRGAECVGGDAFEKVEERAWFIVESIEHDMLDADLRQPDHGFDAGGCKRRVDDDGERRELAPEVFEVFGLNGTCCARIGDDEIDSALLDRGLELRPSRDRDEGMLRTEDDPEMGEEVARKESDDVQAKGGAGCVTKLRNTDTKCEFTVPPATLECRAEVPAKKPAQHSKYTGSTPMNRRRPLVLLALAIASFVCAACTSVTGPTTHNDGTCITGYMGSDGRCVTG